jgi:hypothetical protein
MKVFVFVGPILSREQAGKELEVCYLSLVAQGDLYRVAREDPFVIGIIDGYFERLPSVWHKEILWALSQRIHVFGASSMGALRAAEMAAFGMRGVGTIYRAFADGRLQDDDEVAVTHGDADSGFRAISEAMVNIRATLAAAHRAGVVATGLRRQLETIAKATFYPERNYANLFARAREQGLPEKQLARLASFVASRRVDQKQADARLMLRSMRKCCAAGRRAKAPNFAFQHTDTWEQVVGWAETQPHNRSSDTAAEHLAAEVRLLGEPGRPIVASAYARLAAALLGDRQRTPEIEERIARLDQELRARGSAVVASEGQGGPEPDAWLAVHGLTSVSYTEFLDRQAQFEWLREHHRPYLDRYLLDELRRNGVYAQLERRASHKQRVLGLHGLHDPALADAGLSQSELFAWYFEQRLGRQPPAHLDDALADLGLASANDLEREALRELLYTRLQPPPSSETPPHGNDSGSRERPDASS